MLPYEEFQRVEGGSSKQHAQERLDDAQDANISFAI